jgi:uncharacterized protein (DUF608 family)
MNLWILAFNQLRIVGKFKAIRHFAIYDDPDDIADLQALLEHEADGMWDSLRFFRECANEVLRLLGAATKEDLEVEDLGHGCGGCIIRWQEVE